VVEGTVQVVGSRILEIPVRIVVPIDPRRHEESRAVRAEESAQRCLSADNSTNRQHGSASKLDPTPLSFPTRRSLIADMEGPAVKRVVTASSISRSMLTFAHCARECG
jgi:hypothetical protein